MKFIGIIGFWNGEIWVQLGEYEDVDEALDDMERNDSQLTLLTEEEFNKIVEIVKNNRKKWDGMYKV